jgi:hypothetical protein
MPYALLTVMLLAQTEETPLPEKPPTEEAPKPLDEATAKELAEAARQLTQAMERLTSGLPKPAEPAPVAEKVWAGSLSAGLTWITGNVSSLAFVSSGSVVRKGEKTLFSLKAFGGYGEKADPRDVLLYNLGLATQFDWRFTQVISILIGGGLDTDHVKSVELRGYGEVGVGAFWLDEQAGPSDKRWQKLALKTDLTLRAQPESRFQYYPTPMNIDDAFLFGPKAALMLHYGLGPATYLHEELEVMPNVIGQARVLVNSTTKLAVGIVGGLALTATFALKIDSLPAPGKRPVDTILATGLEIGL